MFSIDLANQRIEANGHSVPLILVGEDRVPWFKANEVALLLGYVNCVKAVTVHVKSHRLKTLQDLREGGLPILGASFEPNGNDLRARYCNESGLYQLTLRSKLEMADAFQDWIVDEVLPTIRKTGAYVAVSPEPEGSEVPTLVDQWGQKRIDGIELHKRKNSALQEVLKGCLGQDCHQAYATVNNLINQVVLNFRCTTSAYKKDKAIPKYMSVPDFLDFHGQVTRCTTEMIFCKYLVDNMDELKELPMCAVMGRLQRLAADMRDSNERFGLGDLEQKLLDRKSASERKRRLNDDRKANIIGPSSTSGVGERVIACL
jgi:prophage antirepressor-like protein